jgi:hypothetical protein
MPKQLWLVYCVSEGSESRQDWFTRLPLELVFWNLECVYDVWDLRFELDDLRLVGMPVSESWPLARASLAGVARLADSSKSLVMFQQRTRRAEARLVRSQSNRKSRSDGMSRQSPRVKSHHPPITRGTNMCKYGKILGNPANLPWTVSRRSPYIWCRSFDSEVGFRVVQHFYELTNHRVLNHSLFDPANRRQSDLNSN